MQDLTLLKIGFDILIFRNRARTVDPDNPQFNNIIGARWVEVGQINVITIRYDWGYGVTVIV